MQEQHSVERELTPGPQQHGQEQQEGRPCQHSPEREQQQRCAPETAPDRQNLQTQQHRGPNPLPTQQHAPSAANQRPHPRLQLASVCQQRYDSELAMLEATLRSPDPFCPRSFITSDATVSPVHKKHKALALDVSDKDTTAQVRQLCRGHCLQCHLNSCSCSACVFTRPLGPCLNNTTTIPCAACRRSRALRHQRAKTRPVCMSAVLAWPQGLWQPCLRLRQPGESCNPAACLELPAGWQVHLARSALCPCTCISSTHRNRARLCVCRSAALERYSSMSLLSPSGGFFVGPMRTPRFSAVLAADMEPQEPQSAHTAAGAGAAGVGSVKAAGVCSSGTALAGSKRRFDDQCTEVCETAQGERGGLQHTTSLHCGVNLLCQSSSRLQLVKANCRCRCRWTSIAAQSLLHCTRSALVTTCSGGHEQSNSGRRAQRRSPAAVAADR